MCTNYTPTRNQKWVAQHLGAELPSEPYPPEAFPGYAAPIALAGHAGKTQCRLARFGLVPHWAQDATLGRKTYNARTETVAEKPSYRTAWRKRQFAIALLDDFFEPNWETGRAVRWRIKRADGEPMGVASLWDQWTDPGSGEVVTSFTMLTVNADGHTVMGKFHRPGDEKRSVVVLEAGQFEAWLRAEGSQANAMLRPPPEGLLVAEAAAVGVAVGAAVGVASGQAGLF
jgi:putative SOS response-associated peptidase YedK